MVSRPNSLPLPFQTPAALASERGSIYQGCHQEPGAGDFPRLLRECPRLLLLENGRKIEPKEIPSSLIPRLPVVFTRQLEILVTTLIYQYKVYERVTSSFKNDI